MTEQPVEELAPLQAVHITMGHRRDDDPRDVHLTVGGDPVVVILFRECPDDADSMDIAIDSTGFDEKEIVDLFRRLADSMEEGNKVPIDETETAHKAIVKNKESEAPNE